MPRFMVTTNLPAKLVRASMPLLNMLLFAVLAMACRSTQTVPQVVKEVTHDSLRTVHIDRDSIFVYERMEQRHDTVYHTRCLYRYRLLRDTLRMARTGTIPVVREVEVTRVDQHIPLWCKMLAAAGA